MHIESLIQQGNVYFFLLGKDKMPTPTNPRLYEAVKKEAKQKFAVWPSAYASGWLVRTYKQRGGTYTDRDTTTAPTEKPLVRWFDEEWVDVCHYLKTGKLKACGRPHAQSKDYPYCRPSKRVSSQTPSTLHEIERPVLESRCARKRKDPSTIVR